MVNQNKPKNVSKVLFELEKFFFNTHNNYSELEISERWATYSDIFRQFQNLNKQHYLHEIHYRLLIGENINTIFIDIINRDNEIYVLLYPFTFALEEFHDFDAIKMFV